MQLVEKLFLTVGVCEVHPEKMIEPVIGVSGSGPAYVSSGGGAYTIKGAWFTIKGAGLFLTVGVCEVHPENMIEPVIGVSGSGPAYVSSGGGAYYKRAGLIIKGAGLYSKERDAVHSLKGATL